MVVRDTVPLLPATRTLYDPEAVPAGTETVNFDVVDWAVDERVTMPGLKVMVGPAGETDAVRVTLPEKLPIAVTFIVDVLDEFWAIVREDGLEVSLKSGSG